MATAQEIREEIRTVIGDDDFENEKYSDQQINVFIRASLRRLKNRVGLTTTIAATGSFDTDPDSAQADLISLQTQCLINQRQFRQAADKGVRIHHDDNIVDSSAGLNGFQHSVYGKFSACALLEEAINDFLTNNPDYCVESVTSKHAESIWAGSANLYEDVDFNGDGSARLWHQGSGRRRRSSNGGHVHDNTRFNEDV